MDDCVNSSSILVTSHRNLKVTFCLSVNEAYFSIQVVACWSVLMLNGVKTRVIVIRRSMCFVVRINLKGRGGGAKEKGVK